MEYYTLLISSVRDKHNQNHFQTLKIVCNRTEWAMMCVCVCVSMCPRKRDLPPPSHSAMVGPAVSGSTIVTHTLTLRMGRLLITSHSALWPSEVELNQPEMFPHRWQHGSEGLVPKDGDGDAEWSFIQILCRSPSHWWQNVAPLWLRLNCCSPVIYDVRCIFQLTQDVQWK